MKKSFDRRKENLIRQQTDDHDHEHDADDLFHGAQLAAVVQQLAESEAGENRDENFRGHERAPGKRPALFHSANDKRQRRRQDHLEPDMQTF